MGVVVINVTIVIVNELCPDCVEGKPVPEKVHLCDSCKRITIDRRPDLAEDIA